MLARAVAAGVPRARVAGDSGYGADAALRRCIAARGRGYVGSVLAATRALRLGRRRVADWLDDAPAEA